MKVNALSSILLILFIIGVLLLGLIISLQVTILSERDSPFNVNTSALRAEAETPLPEGAQLPLTRIVPAVAVATSTPPEEPADAIAEMAPAPVAASTTTELPALAVAASPPTAGGRLLAAHRMTTSSDDHVLVDMVASSPFAVGIVRHATYEEQRGRLRSVPLAATDESSPVLPEPTTVTDGVYPLAYSLYLYTSAQVLQSQPGVATFVGCLLSSAFTDARQVGLFPLAIADYTATVATYSQQTGLVPTCDAAGVAPSPITVQATSALVPLTQRAGSAFRNAGDAGDIAIEPHETQQSARLFCEEGGAHLMAVSRALYEEEITACQNAGRDLISFEVAKDALTVVVSRENNFLTETNVPELQLLFADSEMWADIHTGWPGEPIVRAVPNEQSGGFVTLVSAVFDEGTPNSTGQGVPVATGPGQGVTIAQGNGAEMGLVIAGVEGRPECTTLAGIVAQVVETHFQRPVSLVVADNTDALFDRLAGDVADAAERVDISPCYTDIADRTYLQEKGSNIAMMHNIYGQLGEDKLYMIAHSSVSPRLRGENACLYQFFRQIAVEDMTIMQGQSPTEWMEQNGHLIDSWVRCPG